MTPARLSALALALLLAAGCAPPGPQPLRLQVRDAESGAPVGEAAVDLHPFPSTPAAPAPDHPRAVADAEGRLRVEPGAEPAIWQARAAGYVEQRLVGKGGRPPPRYGAHRDGEADGAIYLYRLPAPALTVLVDDGYSGPLTIALSPAPGFAFADGDLVAVDPQASYAPPAAGQRAFELRASPQGAAELTVVPLLYDLTTDQLAVRDETGPLPWRDLADGQGETRGVWGVVNADDKALFQQIRLFVGTRDAYLAAR